MMNDEAAGGRDFGSEIRADAATIAANEVEGLYAAAAGDRAGALSYLQQAADIEAVTPRGLLQPTVVPPANELLGWQLIRAGEFAKARQAFAAALRLTPNRRNAILGMAKASASP